MSISTQIEIAPPRSSASRSSASRGRASRGRAFARVLNSEFVKLRTLRSTAWSFAILALLNLAFGLTVAIFSSSPGEKFTRVQANDLVIGSLTNGVLVSQLIVAVIGVLAIGGEYSTGQIRSSFAAVPQRVTVLWAKAVANALTTFAISLVSLVTTYFATAPIFAHGGIQTSLFDPAIALPILGASTFLALLGLICMGLGAIIRSIASGIAASIGLILVVPGLLLLIQTEWMTSVVNLLPSIAGTQLFGHGGAFEPWQALLVLLVWIGALFGAASLLVTRRDA